DRLHVLFPRRPGRIPRADERLPCLRKTRRHHAARRQRCGPPAEKNQRALGLDSPAHDTSRSAHLDFLLARLAALGKPQAYAGSAARRVVGCQQDWDVAAAHRNPARVVDDLSRYPEDSIKFHLSAWAGPL